MIIFFLILICFGSSVDSAKCPNDCSNRGTCKSDGTCICMRFREGEDCSIHWKDKYPGWKECFISYVVVSIVLTMSNAVFAVRIIYAEIRLSNHSASQFFNLSNFVIFMILMGSLTRIIYYSMDPDQYFGFDPAYGDSLLWNFSMIMYFNSLFIMYILWLEVISKSEIVGLPSVQKYRPLFIIGICFTSMSLIPLGVYYQMYQDSMSTLLHLGAIIISVLFLILFGSTQGIRLFSFIKKTTSSIKPLANFDSFVTRLTFLLLTVNVLLLLLIIIITVYGFYYKQPYPWLVISLVGRIVECLTVHSVLYFLYAGKRNIYKKSISNNSRHSLVDEELSIKLDNEIFNLKTSNSSENTPYLEDITKSTSPST